MAQRHTVDKYALDIGVVEPGLKAAHLYHEALERLLVAQPRLRASADVPEDGDPERAHFVPEDMEALVVDVTSIAHLEEARGAVVERLEPELEYATSQLSDLGVFVGMRLIDLDRANEPAGVCRCASAK